MNAKSTHDPLCWLVGGEAGYGITTMGQMFAKACNRAGLSVFGYAEYPSLIRGGHNTAMVRVSQEPVRSHSEQIDIMLALNKETIDLHLNEMAEHGIVIYDGEDIALDEAHLASSVSWASVPLARITKELEAKRVMRNTVALGASFAIVGLEFEYAASILESTFARKGQEVVDYNIKVAQAGYDYVKTEFPDGFPQFTKQLAARPERGREMVISGNQACALGAIKAGVKFMSAYPMTPITTVMLTVAAHGVDQNIVMKHTEDEIAAVNMAIGAAHMGVRSMTATSGGGFSLMSEALGMAAITETPLVVVEGTRPGPSTGLPTWTDQGDLRFVMHASQGEFPRVVIMPGNVHDSFWMTAEAFNIAERYQMVVIVLTDKYLAESITNHPAFEHQKYEVDRGLLLSAEDTAALEEGEYKRFEFTENGISKRAMPGSPNCIYAVSTDEHKEDGDLDESAENRIKMVDKRAKKLETLRTEIPESVMFTLHGPEEAELTVVGWGSTEGPILDALEVALDQGLSVNFLQIKWVMPFPKRSVSEILKRAQKHLLIENNAHAQMGGVIAEETGIIIEEKLLRYDGRPLCPEEILKAIQSQL